MATLALTPLPEEEISNTRAWFEDLCGFDQARIAAVEEVFGYRFQGPDFIINAFQHRSIKDPILGIEGNRRLELVGDGLIRCSTTMYALRQHPNLRVSQIDKVSRFAIKNKTLAQVATYFQLSDWLSVGSGIDLRDATLKCHADVVEALFGAIVLDGGYEAAHEAADRLLGPIIDARILQGLTTSRLVYDIGKLMPEVRWEVVQLDPTKPPPVVPFEDDDEPPPHNALPSIPVDEDRAPVLPSVSTPRHPMTKLYKLLSEGYGEFPSYKIVYVSPAKDEYTVHVYGGEHFLASATAESNHEARVEAAKKAYKRIQSAIETQDRPCTL